MSEQKKVRKSYKQLYEDALKENGDLKSELEECETIIKNNEESIIKLQSEKDSLERFTKVQSKTIKDLEDKIYNNDEVINLNSELKNDIVIISSLENKIKDLEGTIAYLKPLVPKKDNKNKEKYKGIKFRQGKFWHDGIGYYKISDIKDL